MHKPNVILITIDTLRADRLGSYGCPRPLTPNLDGLVRTGIRFEQAISGGSWTQAAFPVILTSSYASMYGGCFGRLSPDRPSPIESLASYGYITAGFSTNPHLSKATGYNRGFHHFVDLAPVAKDPILRGIKGGQRLLRSPLTHYLSAPFGKRMRPAPVYTPAAEVTDSACSWLSDVKQPFFAWLHYMDVHWPYHVDGVLTHPKDIALAWHDLAIVHQRANFGREPLTAPQKDRLVRLYEQGLQYLDAEIGRLLECVNKQGYDSNTIIIVLSDHGEEFLDHDRWGHWESNLYDEIVRVPLIIRLPDWTKGQVVQQQVRLLDLMPTILDLCGCPLPDNVEGVTMRPLWSDDGAQYDVVESISEMQRPPWHRIAVRTEAFKYIWDSKRPDQPDLYHLQRDPRETRNVRELYPEEVKRLQACVDEHLIRGKETQPTVAVPELELDQGVVRRLRDLGYVD